MIPTPGRLLFGRSFFPSAGGFTASEGGSPLHMSRMMVEPGLVDLTWHCVLVDLDSAVIFSL